MKATFTLLLLCQWAFTGIAQTTTGWHNVKLKQLYVELGASWATDFRESGKVGDGALTFALSNGWGASYISKGASFKPRSLPADYQQGYFLFIPAPARNHITMNSINVNYNFNIEATSIKFVLSAGPALVTYQEHTFTHTAAFNALGPLLSSSNYMDHYITKTSAGGMLQVTLHIPVSGAFGINYNIYGTAYNSGVICGTGINMLLGHVQKRRHPRRVHFRREPPPPPPFILRYKRRETGNK